MQRIRTVKPEMFLSTSIADVDYQAKWLWVGLLTAADCQGRMADNPRKLRAMFFAYDERVNVDDLLNQLQRVGCIVRYAVAGQRCIAIPKFRDHQRLSGSEFYAESSYPPPPGQTDSTPKAAAGATPKAEVETPTPKEETNHRAGETAAAGGREAEVPAAAAPISPPNVDISQGPAMEAAPPPVRTPAARHGRANGNDSSRPAQPPASPARQVITEFYRELLGEGPLFEPPPTAQELETAEAIVRELTLEKALALIPTVVARMKHKWPDAKRFCSSNLYWEAANAAAKKQRAAATDQKRRENDERQREVDRDAKRLALEMLPAKERERRIANAREKYMKQIANTPAQALSADFIDRIAADAAAADLHRERGGTPTPAERPPPAQQRQPTAITN